MAGKQIEQAKGKKEGECSPFGQSCPQYDKVLCHTIHQNKHTPGKGACRENTKELLEAKTA
jgi:hypothetical protein